MILRKATLDIFSVTDNATEMGQPLIVQQFPDLLAEAQASFTRSDSIEAFKERKPVDYLVDSLSGYLSRTKDGSLFNRYSYRKSKELVVNVDDCQVLVSALKMTCEAPTLGLPASTTEQVTKLGNAYFEFLRERAASLTRSRVSERYPHLSLMYDLMSAGVIGSNTPGLPEVTGLVDRLYIPLVRTAPFLQEIRALADNYVTARKAGFDNIPPSELMKMLEDDEWKTDKIPSSVLQFLLSTEKRLPNGLLFLKHLGAREEDVTVKSLAVDMCGSTFSSELDQSKRRHKVTMAEEQVVEGIVLNALPLDSILSQQGISADLQMNLVPFTHNIPLRAAPELIREVKVLPTTTLDEKLVALRKYATQEKNYRPEDMPVFDKALLTYYLTTFHRERGPIEETSRENQYLWTEILDNSVWFVSPRGDRYSVHNDPELQQFGLQSLTFNVDRTRPREHKVTVRMIGVDHPVELWLSTDRALLNGQREPVISDPSYRDHFANLVLRRMYVITSGLLSTDTEHAPGEGEKSKGFEYRRAHYRVLTSTDRRRITMESPGVQTHAELIKKDYGIDIFEEMRRRRALGTIRPDQYLTFVQESTPSVRGRLVLPNELKFDPLLVQIPE